MTPFVRRETETDLAEAVQEVNEAANLVVKLPGNGIAVARLLGRIEGMVEKYNAWCRAAEHVREG